MLSDLKFKTNKIHNYTDNILYTVPLNYNFILARVDTRGTTTKLY